MAQTIFKRQSQSVHTMSIKPSHVCVRRDSSQRLPDHLDCHQTRWPHQPSRSSHLDRRHVPELVPIARFSIQIGKMMPISSSHVLWLSCCLHAWGAIIVDPLPGLIVITDTRYISIFAEGKQPVGFSIQKMDQSVSMIPHSTLSSKSCQGFSPKSTAKNK